MIGSLVYTWSILLIALRLVFTLLNCSKVMWEKRERLVLDVCHSIELYTQNTIGLDSSLYSAHVEHTSCKCGSWVKHSSLAPILVLPPPPYFKSWICHWLHPHISSARRQSCDFMYKALPLFLTAVKVNGSLWMRLVIILVKRQCCNVHAICCRECWSNVVTTLYQGRQKGLKGGEAEVFL